MGVVRVSLPTDNNPYKLQIKSLFKQVRSEIEGRNGE